jgi:hypothetical protein
MRKLFFFMALFYCFTTGAQPKGSVVDTSKFSIHLPDYWKPGNKVWRILNDKLPTVSEELKNKDLCGDNCKPKYSIEFEMSEPIIVDYFTNQISTGNNIGTWEFVTIYAFSCSLLMFDEQDKLVTRFIIVDKNETWSKLSKATLRSYTPGTPQRIYAQNNRPVAESRMAVQGESPYSYIRSNREKLSPTQRDMLNVIDSKIRAW